jgi:hypothetical protein
LDKTTGKQIKSAFYKKFSALSGGSALRNLNARIDLLPRFAQIRFSGYASEADLANLSNPKFSKNFQKLFSKV